MAQDTKKHGTPNVSQQQIMGNIDLLLVKEVATMARVSISTVRFWMREGRLRSIRPGRRRMVFRSDLIAFLASGSVPKTPPETTVAQLPKRRQKAS